MKTKTLKAYPINYSDGGLVSGLVELRTFPNDVDHTTLTEKEISDLSKEYYLCVDELFRHQVITEDDLMVYERCYEISLLVMIEVMEGNYCLNYHIKMDDVAKLISFTLPFVKSGFEFNFSKRESSPVPTATFSVFWNRVSTENRGKLSAYLESIKLPNSESYVNPQQEFLFPTKIEKVERTSKYPFDIVGFDVVPKHKALKLKKIVDYFIFRLDPSNKTESSLEE